jgi:hypothetical protein
MWGVLVLTTGPIKFDTSDAERLCVEGIDEFGTGPSGANPLQVPDDAIPGQTTPLSWSAARGRPPISSHLAGDV